MLKLIGWMFFILSTFLTMYFNSQYDYELTINVNNYIVKSNLFFIITLYIFITVASFIIIKVIGSILNLPSKIVTNIKNNKVKKDNEKILIACNYFITGDTLEAVKIAKNYLDNSQIYIKKTAALILSYDSNSSKKIALLNDLLNYPETKLFANQQIAQYLFELKDYHNSISYALNAYDINKNNLLSLKILTELYLKLNQWQNYKMMINQIKVLDPIYIDMNNSLISNNYFNAAKNFLHIGDDKSCMDFLHESLLYKPDNLSSINLLAELYVNIDKEELICDIIENAFTYQPSYELYMLYKTYCKAQDLDLYNKLTKNININEHLLTCYGIASDLNLKDETYDIQNKITASYKFGTKFLN